MLRNFKRFRNSTCYECGLEFASRKARHHHQMNAHRKVRVGPTKRNLRIAYNRRQKRLNNA